MTEPSRPRPGPSLFVATLSEPVKVVEEQSVTIKLGTSRAIMSDATDGYPMFFPSRVIVKTIVRRGRIKFRRVEVHGPVKMSDGSYGLLTGYAVFDDHPQRVGNPSTLMPDWLAKLVADHAPPLNSTDERN